MLTLLEKGLSFIPSRQKLPVANLLETRDNLIRRLKLRDFFKEPTAAPPARRFVEKSTFIPPTEKLSGGVQTLLNKINAATTKFIRGLNGVKRNACFPVQTPHSVTAGRMNYPSLPVAQLREKQNLSAGERQCINELSSNGDIIIKPADKGGATVVMNKTSYVREAQRQLSNCKYYAKLPLPIYHSNVEKIRTVLGEILAAKRITKNQYRFLSGPATYNARTFYLLPKIHKPREKWPSPDMPEGRPIVSDVGSETYRVSEYIDSFINPLACKHQSYVKNSYDFVEKVRNVKIEKDWLLVTGDVSALYTNMHFNRTIDCVRRAFAKNPDPNRPDDAVIKLLEISLKNNDFNFNGEYYLQVLGTAMGKRFAPGLANLYLLDLDEAAMAGLGLTRPVLFIRYLDDIFYIWPGTVDSLRLFEAHLNSLIPDIKISFEYSKEQISFLDICIYVGEDGFLKTKTFFKETDTHQLLHTASFHPRHVFKGLVKSQLIRFKRLSSTAEDYNSTCKVLFSFLKKRGYKQCQLRKQQYQVWFGSSATDGRAKDNQLDSRIPIVVDFCRAGTNLVKKYRNILKNDDYGKNIGFITAYRNGPNLKRRLVKSKLYNAGREGAFRGCSSARCLACRLHAPPTKTCKIENSNASYVIRNDIDCNTSNVIYVVTCDKCKKQYVGETSRCIRDRLNDHKSDIKNRRKTPLATHFLQPDHSTFNLKITPIEVVENRFQRMQREKELQRLFKTVYPHGINNTPVEN